ncbi:TRAP transporter small permease [Paenibacillus abyssi]|uniref:TRAP transporter small permease n=1 Tax=Paenibacillus abyssi TaxID=1340531 RepID=UPI00166A04F5
MKRLSKFLLTLLNSAMAIILASMAILVFANVVLRYLFDSGITWSEEMSRYLFVFLIFLGAIGALKNNEHLGVDLLIKNLPKQIKRVVYIFTNLLLLFILYLVADGSLTLALLNLDSRSSATGIPLSVNYAVGVFFSVCMGLIILLNSIRAMFDKDAIDELTAGRSAEEAALEEHNQHQSLQGGGHK